MKKYIKLMIKKYVPVNKLVKISRTFEKVKSGQPNEKYLYPIIKYSIKNKDVFFGYYDINPCLNDNILALSVDGDNDAEILVCNGENINVIADTKAWCWQQGCRLRWICRENKQIISWNDFADGEYVARFMDYQTGTIDTLKVPLYDISKQGNWGVTIDFQRLGYLRPGYGYRNLPFNNKINPKDYAIKLIDLVSFLEKRIITYEDIMSLMNEKFDLAMCYINHVSFNPQGNIFLFFFIHAGEIHKANLFIYDIGNNKLKILENQLSVSHYCWIDNSTILVTAYDNRRQCRYYIYDIQGGRQDFMHKELRVDGHPTWIDSTCLITDTYPDKQGFQFLYKINTLNNSKETLAKIYSSPKRLGEERTDLHPRVDLKNHRICFDSNVKGKRTFCVMEDCI